MYGNRRRIRGARGRRLMRRRGERIERSFAHLYDTGGMRRTHLRRHPNILKRLLIHAGGFNLGLVMHHLICVGTPRDLQGPLGVIIAMFLVLVAAIRRRVVAIGSSRRRIVVWRGPVSATTLVVNSSVVATCTTGCYYTRGRSILHGHQRRECCA